MKRAIFLDRDGVINDTVTINGNTYPPARLEDLVIYEDVLPALNQLKQLGFYLFIVTNQPDAARGKTSIAEIDRINQHIQQQLPIDKVYVCFHDNHHACTCRKPQAGMLLAAAAEYALDLRLCFMVGDRWRDIQAGHHAGCKTILIERFYDEPFTSAPPHRTVTHLGAAATWITEQITTQELSI